VTASGSPGGTTLPCRLCGGEAKLRFQKRVLGRHLAGYYQCAACGLTQSEEPHWLEEAYATPIADIDTGLLARNLHACRMATVFLHIAHAGGRPCLDWAGGYGVFTRLMRDAGFEFHWQDRFTENRFARGFEWDPSFGPPFACTAFEVLEHLPRPLEGFRELASFGAEYLITSTEIHPGPAPGEDWFYLAPESGQHVAFYRRDTLARLGRESGYPVVHTGPHMQLFARRPFPAWWWCAANLPGTPFYPLVRRLRRSLTDADSVRLRGRSPGA
jgi:hypothetical protein